MENVEEEELRIIPNNNGEWINSNLAVFLDPSQVEFYERYARKYNLPLNIQKMSNGEVWAYCHEIKAIDEHYYKENGIQPFSI
jgi:hypothetical protein